MEYKLHEGADLVSLFSSVGLALERPGTNNASKDLLNQHTKQQPFLGDVFYCLVIDLSLLLI